MDVNSTADLITEIIEKPITKVEVRLPMKAADAKSLTVNGNTTSISALTRTFTTLHRRIQSSKLQSIATDRNTLLTTEDSNETDPSVLSTFSTSQPTPEFYDQTIPVDESELLFSYDAFFFAITFAFLIVLLLLLAMPIRILLRIFTKTKLTSVIYKTGLNPNDSVMFIPALMKTDEDEIPTPSSGSQMDDKSSGYSVFRLFRR